MPYQLSNPWAILLLKFVGNNVEPNKPAFYRDFFVNRGTSGMCDYWWDVSYGNIDFTTSSVFGWMNFQGTKGQFNADVQKRATDLSNKLLKSGMNAGAVQDAVIAAQLDRVVARDWARSAALANGIKLANFGNIIVCANEDIGIYGGSSHVVGSPMIEPGQCMAVFAQEMAHGMGLPFHSERADNPNVVYGNPYDAMSTLAYPGTSPIGPQPNFGHSGPGLNGPNLDFFKWLAEPRKVVIDDYRVVDEASGPDSFTFTRQYTLTALNHPENQAILLLMISLSPTGLVDALDYTVEFRANDGWDRGIGDSFILIHHTRVGQRNYIHSAPGGGLFFNPGDTMVDSFRNVAIKVISKDPIGHTAVVEVSVLVRNVRRIPTAGPVPIDWHIYERGVDLLAQVERASAVMLKEVEAAKRVLRKGVKQLKRIKGKMRKAKISKSKIRKWLAGGGA